MKYKHKRKVSFQDFGSRSYVRFCVGSHKLGAITPFLPTQPLTSSADEDVNIDFIVDGLTTLC